MTCILAIKDNSGIGIIADSLFMNPDFSLNYRAEGKLINFNDEMVIGATTSGSKVFQVLRYKFKAPKLPSDEAKVMEFLVTKFIPAFEKILSEESLLDDKKEFDGTFILITKYNKIYEISSDLDIAEIVHPYVAVGSASDFAVGAAAMLLATKPDMPLTEKLETAISLAEHHSAAVRKPYTTIIFKGE